MTTFSAPSFFAFAFASLMVLTVGEASALDKSRSVYNVLAAQPNTATRMKVPASYRIVLDNTRQTPKSDGASRYFGGAIRTLIIDGRPMRMSESEIIENIRSGHFVPVYTETGARLSREDWEVSLPHWLGYATRDYADQ